MANYTMKTYSLNDVLPGMQVGKDILNDGGQVMVVTGTVLTANIIEGLECWDINSITIRTEVPDAPPVVIEEPIAIKKPVVIEPPVAIEPPSPPIQLSEAMQQFSKSYDSTTDALKSSFEKMRFLKEVPLEQMQDIAKNEVFSMIESVGIINHLQMVHHKDNYTFEHSINVSVICGVLGKWLGYKGTELADIVLAGLLHDIGKTQIPVEILNKPDLLTDAEMKVMQTHALLGYELLNKNTSLAPEIIYAVLQHHERMDGSGYPFRLTMNKLNDYSKIIAVADIYDAMTSDRVYNKKRTPFEVVETMASEMYHKLDPRICTVFLNNVRNYFIGNIVKLTDGRRAEVVYLGPIMGTRPTVRTDNGEFIDLETNKHIGIIELVET